MATPIATPVHTTVVGVFDVRARAWAAIDGLREAGFRNEQLGFLGPDPQPESERLPESEVEDGIAAGAAIGAVTGGVAGLALAASVFTPVGPAIAAGALVTYFSSVGLGAAGGLIGGLIGAGIPEDDSHWYQSELKAGRSLVTVHEADERAEEARDILRRDGATIRLPSNVGSYGTGLPATPF
jgi:hypothetical protein